MRTSLRILATGLLTIAVMFVVTLALPVEAWRWATTSIGRPEPSL